MLCYSFILEEPSTYVLSYTDHLGTSLILVGFAETKRTSGRTFIGTDSVGGRNSIIDREGHAPILLMNSKLMAL